MFYVFDNTLIVQAYYNIRGVRKKVSSLIQFLVRDKNSKYQVNSLSFQHIIIKHLIVIM